MQVQQVASVHAPGERRVVICEVRKAKREEVEGCKIGERCSCSAQPGQQPVQRALCCLSWPEQPCEIVFFRFALCLCAVTHGGARLVLRG